MDKYRKINNFDIQLLREFPGLTVYNDQLFLNDSIDDRWPKKVKMFPSLPAKMRFTTIFLCVDGEARTRVSGSIHSVNKACEAMAWSTPSMRRSAWARGSPHSRALLSARTALSGGA